MTDPTAAAPGSLPPPPVAPPPAPSARPRWLVAIPTAITLGNALCGFAAVVLLAGWRPEQGLGAVAAAGWLILAAWICDMTDGMAARMTGSVGPFGAALDSLCDVVGFGVAPAFLAGSLALAADWPGWVAWGAGATLLAGVLVRLARFDALDVAADADPEGHLWFNGLPSPAVGAVIATLGLTWWAAAASDGLFAWTGSRIGSNVAAGIGLAMPFAAIAVGALAVSTWRYPDLPKHYARRLQPRWHLALLALGTIALGPGPALLVFFLAFAALGPLAGRRA